MKLHTAFITYNRLELTKRAIGSYLETVTLPYTMWVVDNASEDGTQEWIAENIREIGMGYTLMRENRYPGAAANSGWEAVEFTGIAEGATHLQRADNDFEFLPGWCNEVERCFRQPNLGQLGLRTDKEEMRNRINVGGNCIITRKLWNKGLRYDERPWPQIAKEVGKGWSEDGLMSIEVKKRGYAWGRVKTPCINALSLADKDDPYYVKSLGDRGVTL